MSKEFWIAFSAITCCFFTAYFTKILIGYEKPVYSPVHSCEKKSFEKRILVLETKMAILLQEREENKEK
jgi:hypothetical protein